MKYSGINGSFVNEKAGNRTFEVPDSTNDALDEEQGSRRLFGSRESQSSRQRDDGRADQWEGEVYREIEVFKSLVGERRTESASIIRLAGKRLSVFRLEIFLKEEEIQALEVADVWNIIANIFKDGRENIYDEIETEAMVVVGDKSDPYVLKQLVNLDLYENQHEKIGAKIKADDSDDNSNDSTWAGIEKKTKAKYTKVYVTSMYRDTDFGFADDEAESIEGAEIRKKLSDSRVL
ncbi:hypothetical protein G6F37_007670 [Rhizopus arrhizus]|nr:hypothetical protein G6F38_007717 [Rhizopus arrhizus]KAG1156372.1 hypothetical protein G6F37_007670 [Rhizopus arrhizus]